MSKTGSGATRLAARPTLVAALTAAAIACAGGRAPAADLVFDASVPPSRMMVVGIPAGQIERAVERLDALAAEIMQRSGIPGMAVAVVHGGRTVYAKGFGLRQTGEAAVVDADTVFQLASLSKPIGATVVARQVGEGRIGWDTPVKSQLPWIALSDAWVSDHVTVGDLYAHRSGLHDHAGDQLEELGFDRRDILERLRHAPLGAFRAQYAYTNFGITLAAEAVAAAAQADWETLSETTLYAPLGMTSTSSRLADFLGRDNRAAGHVLEGGAYVAAHQRRPDAQSPAGGVSSSVNDMARWMAMVLQDGQVDGKRLIDATALTAALTPQMLSAPVHGAAERAGFYGFGFNVGVAPSGRTLLSHSGAFLLGAGTSLTLIPSADTGIVVLTNAAPTGAGEALAAAYADLVQFGQVTRDWLAAYSGLMAGLYEPFGSLAGKVRPANARPPAALAAYAGTYANDFYGEARIEQQDSGLVMRLGPQDQAFPLSHWDGDRFTFAPFSENANHGSISALTFDAAADGVFGSLQIEYFGEDVDEGVFVRPATGK